MFDKKLLAISIWVSVIEISAFKFGLYGGKNMWEKNSLTKRLVVFIVCNILLTMSLGGLGKSKEVLATSYGLNNPKVSKSMFQKSYWDTIYFGHYKQDGDKKEPIKWRVLSVKGNDVFLISDTVIEWAQFNKSSRNDSLWEKSDIRKWLNTEFMNKAFSKKEQKAIKTTTVNNSDDAVSGEKENNTKDKIFLLSLSELNNLEYGLKSAIYKNSYAGTENSEYVHSKACDINPDDYMFTSTWWLRTTESVTSKAHVVGSSGFTGYGVSQMLGRSYKNRYRGIRPALHIKLSSNQWEDAGTIDSEGSHVVFAPVISSVKNNKKRTVKLIWYKSAGADGYEIRYSTHKNMSSAKTIRIKKRSKTAITLKKLRKKKIYYIQMRIWKKSKGRLFTSGWGSKKKVKVKR